MLIEKSHEMPRCHLDLDIHLPHNPTNQSSKRSPHIFSFSRKLAISLLSIPNENIKKKKFLCFPSISSLVLLAFLEIFQYRFWVFYYYQTTCRTLDFLCDPCRLHRNQHLFRIIQVHEYKLMVWLSLTHVRLILDN